MASKKDHVPLALPKLMINNCEINRVDFMKFLGVLIHENITWSEHIKHVQTKVSKNLGLLYKAKNYLDKRPLLSLYYSCIHTYFNYGNLVWASTAHTNLRKINSQQKHAIRIIHNENKLPHARSLMKSSNILNVYPLNCQLNILNYQLNILNVLAFNASSKSKNCAQSHF